MVFGIIPGKNLTCLTFPGFGAFLLFVSTKCLTFPGFRAFTAIHL